MIVEISNENGVWTGDIKELSPTNKGGFASDDTLSGLVGKLHRMIPKVLNIPEPKPEPIVFTPEILEANKLTRVRVSVVVLVWNQDFSKLLLGEREVPNKQGIWVIPGGKIEFGQTMLETASSEIMQEAGLEIQLLSDTPVCVKEIIDEVTHRLLIYYEGQSIGGELKAGSDLKEARFLEPKEIAALPLTDLTKEVIAIADEEFAVECGF